MKQKPRPFGLPPINHNAPIVSELTKESQAAEGFVKEGIEKFSGSKSNNCQSIIASAQKALSENDPNEAAAYVRTTRLLQVVKGMEENCQ